MKKHRYYSNRKR